MNGPIPAGWSPRLLSILRITAGFMFMLHGTMKLFGWPGDGDPMQLASLMGLAGIIEGVGGLLLMLGLFTRPVAFVAAGQMAAAYFMAHAGQSPWPVANGGETAALFCFIWLYIAAAGPGPWSVDARLGRGWGPEERR